MISVIVNLKVDSKQMLYNMVLTQGRNMSEAVMMRLTEKGISRQVAHELLRKLTITSEVENRNFKEILLENEINSALDPKNYLGTTKKQIEKFLKI
jgi:adenylosuccinate lyase